MKKFLKAAGLTAIFSAGAVFSAQAADPVAPETASDPARWTLTAQDSASSKALSFSINKYVDFTVEGYVAASGTFDKYDHKTANGSSGRNYSLFDSETGNLDSAFVGFKASNKQTGVSAYASILWVPDGHTSNEAGILDAYLQWSKETNVGTFTVTAGKFLSYFGFESYYIPNLDQLSYGLESFFPGYHTGLKLDYSKGAFSAGFAVVDSLFSSESGNHFNQGDGKFKGVGLELTAAYVFNEGKAHEFTLAGTIGYDTDKDDLFSSYELDGNDEYFLAPEQQDFAFNLWGSYKIQFRNQSALTLTGELSYKNYTRKLTGKRNEWSGPDRAEPLVGSVSGSLKDHDETFGWAIIGKYQFEKGRLAGLSFLARLSSAYYEDNNTAYKLTLAPSYAITKNFLVRGEFSWTHGDEWYVSGDYPASKNNYFFGLQTVFTF